MNKSNYKIVSRDTDFSEWYTSIINQAKLVMYVDIKGFMIFQPYGWQIWENIIQIMDYKFKKLGIKNMYVPLLIPMSEFEKEKEHVEGFAPELFLIDRIGNKKLESVLAIRPTSEIWFSQYFKNSITSYKDLPIKVNQWTSVLRAEKNTRPFLRNSEFHWHETHCVFEEKDEAIKFTIDMLELYYNFCHEYLCIPVIKGIKTNGERFAGADISYTIEAMMQDGQALQSGTSHMLGQSFAKSYNIQYQSKDNSLEYPYQTSHGLTTRIIGAIIMVHGDDKGLVLPIDIAPIQINLIPLLAEKNPEVNIYCEKISKLLSDKYRVQIDKSNKSMGYMLNESEIQGIPINIVVGPKDVLNNTLTIIRRDDSNDKLEIKFNDLTNQLEQQIKIFKSNIYNKAKNQLENSIQVAKSIEDIKNIVNNKKWAQAYFDGSVDDENKIKELTGATPRCIIDQNAPMENCVISNKPTKQIVIFARAY